MLHHHLKITWIWLIKWNKSIGFRFGTSNGLIFDNLSLHIECLFKYFSMVDALSIKAQQTTHISSQNVNLTTKCRLTFWWMWSIGPGSPWPASKPPTEFWPRFGRVGPSYFPGIPDLYMSCSRKKVTTLDVWVTNFICLFLMSFMKIETGKSPILSTLSSLFPYKI